MPDFSYAYLQTDPLVASTWNAYAYAGNNPIMATDPSGLADEDSCPAGSPICQSDETIVIEGGSKWGIPADIWWFFNAPAFGIWSPTLPPSGGGGGAIPCPPAKDCKNKSFNELECKECCQWNFDEHDMCECERKASPALIAECIEKATAWWLECTYVECKNIPDIHGPGTGLDGIGGAFDGSCPRCIEGALTLPDPSYAGRQVEGGAAAR